MMPTLYALTDAYIQVWQMALSEDVDTETIENTLQSIEAAIEAKAQCTAAVIKEIDAMADMVDAEIKRLQARKQAMTNKSKHIKDYLHAQLDKAGKDKVVTLAFTIQIQNNPPAVEVSNIESIPSKYQIIKYDIDKKAIAADLKAGEEVPGARLVQGRSLRIR